eukprot:scaffold395841_cov17-Prasinocladus_malaysianus.AAC.1
MAIGSPASGDGRSSPQPPLAAGPGASFQTEGRPDQEIDQELDADEYQEDADTLESDDSPAKESLCDAEDLCDASGVDVADGGLLGAKDPGPNKQKQAAAGKGTKSAFKPPNWSIGEALALVESYPDLDENGGSKTYKDQAESMRKVYVHKATNLKSLGQWNSLRSPQESMELRFAVQPKSAVDKAKDFARPVRNNIIVLWHKLKEEYHSGWQEDDFKRETRLRYWRSLKPKTRDAVSSPPANWTDHSWEVFVRFGPPGMDASLFRIETTTENGIDGPPQRAAVKARMKKRASDAHAAGGSKKKGSFAGAPSSLKKGPKSSCKTPTSTAAGVTIDMTDEDDAVSPSDNKMLLGALRTMGNAMESNTKAIERHATAMENQVKLDALKEYLKFVPPRSEEYMEALSDLKKLMQK